MKTRKHLHPFWRRAAASFLILLICLPGTLTARAAGVTITPLVDFDPGSNPAGLVYGPEQSLWTSLPGAGAIGQAASATPQIHPLPDAAMRPWDITIGADRALWFTIENRDAIGRLDPSGGITQFALGAGVSGAGGLALGQDRGLWFTESDANRIGRLDPSGKITHFDLPGENRRPMSIHSAPNGDLWFTEWDSYSIGKITLSGEISEYDLPERTRPADLLVMPEGSVWVIYNLGKNIARFDPAQETFAQYTLATKNTSLADLTLGPDQRIWYLGTHAVGSFEVINGAPANLVEEPLTKPIYSYQGRSQIIAGPDNNLIFTLANSNTVYQSPLQGAPLLRDLQVFITSSPTHLLTVGEFQIEGQITNWSRTDATGVEIHLTLDENIHLLQAEVPGATCTESGLSLTCSLPSLSAGDSLPVRFAVATERIINGGPDRTLSLSATCAEGDYQPSNNRVVLPLTLQPLLKYSNDFSQGADDHWQPALTSSPVDGLDVLGPFGNDEVTFEWDHLPPHDRARVCFDLYILGPWGGSQPPGENGKTAAPHLWASYIKTNPADPAWQQLTLSSFSNQPGYQQSFPVEYQNGLHPAQTGASQLDEFDGLPGTRDARYFICHQVEHRGDSLQLLLKGANLNAAAKWAVDNARISVYNDAALIDRIYFPFIAIWNTGS